MSKRKGLSLVEIIVATVILTLAFGGLFAAFIGIRRYTTNINGRIIAANLARQALEGLYDGVSADTWDTGDLSVGNDKGLPEYRIDRKPYGEGGAPSSWDVTQDTANNRDYRQVNIDIGYKADDAVDYGGQAGP